MLYRFLNSVSDEFDQKKRDLLREKSLPEVKIAYTTIRLEMDRRYVMRATKRETKLSNGGFVAGIGSGFSTKLSLEDVVTIAGAGYTTKPQPSTGKGNLLCSFVVDRKTMRCNHCGKIRHNKAECFQVIGFSNGWRRQRREGIGVWHPRRTVTEQRRAPKKRGPHQLGFSKK